MLKPENELNDKDVREKRICPKRKGNNKDGATFDGRETSGSSLTHEECGSRHLVLVSKRRNRLKDE